MALKISTKLKNVMLESISTALLHGAIYIYSGSQPASADAAPTGTLLGIATVGAGAWTSPGSVSNGVDFAAAASGSMAKASGEVWQFVGIAAGTAGWFRHVSGAAADSLTTDTNVYPRIDGRISTSGAEMNISNLSIAVGATTTIDSYTISWPANF
jgi:hypothetical protein